MQNKLYTMPFSHHPMTKSQSVPKQQLRKPELTLFANSAKLQKKTVLPEKFELMDKSGFELRAKRRAPCPPANPLSLTEHDVHGMEYFLGPS